MSEEKFLAKAEKYKRKMDEIDNEIKQEINKENVDIGRIEELVEKQKMLWAGEHRYDRGFYETERNE